MATLEVLVQGRGTDKGLNRYLKKSTKQADLLGAALDRLAARDKTTGRTLVRMTKQADALTSSLTRLASQAKATDKAIGGMGRGGSRRRKGGEATTTTVADGEGRRTRRRRLVDFGDSAAARAGSERERRAARRGNSMSADERALLRARRRGEQRAQRELDAEADVRLGRTTDAGRSGRRGRRGKRGLHGNMDLAGDAASAAQEWRHFGGEVRGGIEASVSSFMDYEKAIADVTTVTEEIPVDQIKQITTDAVREFGGLPTDQVAAFYEIVSAGATDAKSATEQLTQANILAIGGQAEAADAVLAISKGVSNFKEQGATATEVADSLFVAVQKGQANITQMARALPRVAQAASATGLSLDETNAALAVLSLKSPTAEEGATNLKAALSNIQKPTKAAREEAKRLGIDFSVAGVKAAGGFDKFLLKLRASEKFNDNSLAKLFDSSDARAAVGALMSDMEGYQSTLDAMGNKEGQAAKAYDKMADTNAQKAEKLKAEWELLKITAGEALIPALSELGKQVGPILKNVTQWIKDNPKLAGTIAKVALGVAGLSMVLGPVISGVSLLTSTLGLGQGAFAALGPAAGGAGKALGAIAAKIGPAGGLYAAAAVGAFALGAAFGTWLDNKFGISDFLADTVGHMTGLNQEMRRLERATPSKIQHEGRSDEQVLLDQRQRLLDDLAAKKKLAGDAWIDPGDVKAGLLEQAQGDLRNFDRANAEKLGLSDTERFDNAGLSDAINRLTEAVGVLKQPDPNRGAPALATWTGPSLDAGVFG